MKASVSRNLHLPPAALVATAPAALVLALLAAACNAGAPEVASGRAEMAPPAPSAVPAPTQAHMEGADEAFFVTLPSGDKVIVGVFPNPGWAGRKLLFDPPVAKLDANIHPLAQNALWEVYGRQRGHASPADMRVAVREKLGSILTFKLSTGGLLCVFPLQDDNRPLMKGMLLWVE